MALNPSSGISSRRINPRQKSRLPGHRPGPAVSIRQGTCEMCPPGHGQARQKPPCPACPEGALIPSQSGDNLRCSNFPACQHLSPRCPGCRRGYVSLNEENSAAECSNPVCDSPPRLCPRCGKGNMLLRTGQTRFWECSRYNATPSCTHTVPANQQDGSRTTPGGQPTSRRRGRRSRYPSKR